MGSIPPLRDQVSDYIYDNGPHPGRVLDQHFGISPYQMDNCLRMLQEEGRAEPDLPDNPNAFRLTPAGCRDVHGRRST